ncbi:hypothetical protein KKE06_03945 [Candidatus Micrarchaeota archaeon]|nr:hypothetical protein [Candidatus Micrarchaeota archaeon]MBU1930812.1 hypothetical protein [Candidatus Micrarchaeota archaeon]
MNQKGVFLTLMVFFVAIVAVTLAISSVGMEKERESLLPESTARYVVDEQFEQIYYDIENLLVNPKRSQSKSRNLLFEYTLEADNVIWLEQSLPITGQKFDEFNNYLNKYALFSGHWDKKTSIETTFNFQRLKNTFWGGSQRWPVYKYILFPQCIVYELNYQEYNTAGKRIMSLEKGTEENNCIFNRTTNATTNFEKRIRKAEVRIDSDAGLISNFSCTGSFSGCPKTVFNSINPRPYAKLEFYQGDTLIDWVGEHFDPKADSENKISFRLDDGSLEDQNVTFSGNSDQDPIARIDLSGALTSTKTTAGIKLSLIEPPTSFVLEGLSIIVTHPGFGVRRLSQIDEQIFYCGDGFCDSGEEGTCSSDCP